MNICMSLSKHKGIVLLMTLIFMQIFTLIGLYSISESIVLLRISQNELEYTTFSSENTHESQADKRG